jgi:hypothetical protein
MRNRKYENNSTCEGDVERRMKRMMTTTRCDEEDGVKKQKQKRGECMTGDR